MSMAEQSPAGVRPPDIARDAFHELNNHLGVALINTSMLRRKLGELDPPVRQHLELLSRSLDSVRALTCQLRDLVQLLQVGGPLTLEPLELAPLLEEAADPCVHGVRTAPVCTSGTRILGQRDLTVRLFSTLLGASASAHASLRIVKESARVRFHLEVPIDPDSPGTMDLALALGEQLVTAHQGAWRSSRHDQSVAVDFTLPAAP
jgi:hypothetical protein